MTMDAGLGTPEQWNAYVRQVELETTGHYSTPRYGTAGYWQWVAAGQPQDTAFLYTEEWRAYQGLPAWTSDDTWNAFVAAGAPGWNDFVGGGGGAQPGNALSPTAPGSLGAGSPISNAAQPSPADLVGGDASAIAALQSALNQYGLGGLANFAWDEWKKGIPIEQIMLDVRGTPEYKARFPGMDQLASIGRAISETQWINLEQTYASQMRAAGLPFGFYDQPSDFQALIVGEVSPEELQKRIDTYVNLAYQLPREVLDQFAQQSGFANFGQAGWSNGDLAAFLMDPQRALPAILQQKQRAEIGGAAAITGFNPQLNGYDIARLQQLGVDFNAALKGFNQLTQMHEIFNPLVGSARAAINQSQQIGAEFGYSASDQRLIQDEIANRVAVFQAGGTVAGSQRGQSGAGTSQ